MIKSINKYKGFYIGRYETGDDYTHGSNRGYYIKPKVVRYNENINYVKKPSFLNISTAGINQENLAYKETKSENIDESCEKLQNRMSGLFLNKNYLRKINQTENKNSLNNYSFVVKTTNKSINNINIFYNNPEEQNIDKSTNINNQIKQDENKNNLSLTHIPNGNEDIQININDNKKDDSISDDSFKENLKINNMINLKNVNNQDQNIINEKDGKLKFKLKVSKSFNSLPNNLEKESDSEFQIKNEDKRKSIISQGIKKYNSENIFGSINDIFNSAEIKDNKEYNFTKKEIKRYKNIDEIKDDKNYFRYLYLSSNLIELIKKKSKYCKIFWRKIKKRNK